MFSKTERIFKMSSCFFVLSHNNIEIMLRLPVEDKELNVFFNSLLS